MNANVSDYIVENYFKIIKNWDINSKKNLIDKIKSSMQTNLKNQLDLSPFFGIWEDERSADEIIKEIIMDRVNSKELEGF